MIDPFRDGRGPERAGKVIASFLDGIDSGKSRDVALKNAVDEYRLMWGKNRVSFYGEKKEDKGNRVWRKIRNSVTELSGDI